mmetsp:Transcript_33766/g.82826  ORF Transcript_33766/g.82826 Transcript_33766/m.82826 type:complete len:243 (-) Transcript_33766:109-837(-)
MTAADAATAITEPLAPSDGRSCWRRYAVSTVRVASARVSSLTRDSRFLTASAIACSSTARFSCHVGSAGTVRPRATDSLTPANDDATPPAHHRNAKRRAPSARKRRQPNSVSATMLPTKCGNSWCEMEHVSHVCSRACRVFSTDDVKLRRMNSRCARFSLSNSSACSSSTIACLRRCSRISSNLRFLSRSSVTPSSSAAAYRASLTWFHHSSTAKLSATSAAMATNGKRPAWPLCEYTRSGC